MNQRRRVLLASFGTVVLFLLVQFGALALVEPFRQQGFQPVENPTDPTNSLVYFGFILLATAAMLAVFRYGGERIVRVTILLVAGFISWYVFVVFLPAAPTVGGTPLLPLAAAALVVVALYVHPEWYVIDGAGVIMGAGAAGLFGIGFGPLPALVLLVVLAVYDAVSVYGTEHMLTLAEGVMTMKVPVLLIIPTSRSFSFRELDDETGDGEESTGPQGGADDETDAGFAGDDQGVSAEAAADRPDTDAGAEDGTVPDGTDAEATAGSDAGPEGEAGTTESDPLTRDALFIGLGDAVIPTVLVASAGFFLDAPPLVEGIALNVPALGAMVGTVAGLVVLLWMVFKGRAHAGLPLLNSGAIIGYVAGAVAAGIPIATALGL